MNWQFCDADHSDQGIFCAETDLSHAGGKVPVVVVTQYEGLAMNSNEFDIKAISIDELHSACFIDESGREIPITREMIENACWCLADTFRVPRSASIN